ncbi:MAG TPA: Rrf2 family transcriptional regulator [Thermoleophilia bacterium]|nr:Rrf2 family transcriptional regulator [Thermoleophilia bacterium]HQG02785.1 Rrf2 family transcriptional regulator [Thermoleophilia bacterium]HQG54084.1 Rrf2 family transcriptional regulator [Thermoleophilia bacterium]HQJ97601.1 Rrf2 family transcriptional regulator [Thermoleophilia bacterium]
MGLQLTRGGEYAIRAMVYLAQMPEGRIAALHEIGHAQDIPESFLAKILQSLVHAGLAESRRGARGGFALARPARDITLRAVIEAVDGPVALNVCVLFPEDCDRSSRCSVHDVWVEAQERMMSVLDGVTIESVKGAKAGSPAG